MQKVSCNNYDVINVYRSKEANRMDFLNDLGSLARGPKPCFIVGDFNIDYLKDPNNSIIQKISSCDFQQIVEEPTHSAGGLLDHVYVKNSPWLPDISINFPFYTDHAAIAIIKPRMWLDMKTGTGNGICL